MLKNLFSNLAESLLIKLAKPPDKCNLNSVIQYCSSFATTANFYLVGTTEKQVLKIMQDIKSSIAPGIDKISRKFLKDGNDILAKPVSFFFFFKKYLFSFFEKYIQKNQ